MSPPISQLLRQLRIVERAIPTDIRRNDDYRGIRVDESGTKLSIAVSSLESVVERRLRRNDAFRRALKHADLKPDTPDDSSKTVPLGVSAGEGGYQSRCGDPRFWAPNNRETGGTLGWFLWLNNHPICVGSYHVFCKKGDQTPIRSTCVYRRDPRGYRFDERIGTLWKFDPAKTRKRLYDCALVKLLSVKAATGTFRRVSGVAKPYPVILGHGSLLAMDELYYILGATSRTGDLRDTLFRGVGSAKLANPLGGDSMFHEQLFFDARTANGDSGAIIVHSNTNAVIGLVVAGGGDFTIANPLYRKRWKFMGLKTSEGVTLPSFRTY